MRVLILANEAGGLWVFRRELLEALVQEHEVHYCVPMGNAVNTINSLGCHYIPCELLERHGTNPVTEFRLISFYRNVIRDIKPDIVFTYTIKCNAYGGMACSSLHVPYVANITGLGTSVENGGIMQKVTLLLYRLGLRKAQKVFFQNTDNRDFMVSRGVVKKNYDMLPGSGVNLERFELCPYPNGGTIDFIFVARVMKEKGIEQYIDAAKSIRKKYPETRFHICGFCEQDYKETLTELNNQEIVIYHGLVADMKPIYQMAACTVHPTYYPEGMSNVLLESCATGRPIITTDRPGCKEIVDDKVNGFIVKQKDSNDLIQKIESFMRLSWEERREMGLQGRKKVEREFDRNIVIKKYLKEMESV